ncbi:MAG: hypothetical protein FJZ98_08335 [Chloroflexi bacterium]|nr:hypothetical protein [Chloroflexota bacterium]
MQIVFAKWGFELRSVTKLIALASPFALPLSILLYFFIFRNLSQPFTKDFRIYAIGICTSALISSRLVPQQLTVFRFMIAFLLTCLLFLVIYSFLIEPLFKSKNFPWERILIWAAFISGLAGMAVIFIDSLYTRMYSDDFCYAISFDELGFPGAGLWFYHNWSGRFFSNFLVMAFTDTPSAVASQIILTILSLFFSLYVLSKSGNSRPYWLAYGSFALFFTLTVSVVTRDFYKSFFWICSSLILFPLFILIPPYIAGIFRLGASENRDFHWLAIPVFFLSFFISTIHEIAVLGWLALNGGVLAWLMAKKIKKKYLKVYLVAGIIAAALGLALMLVSPGNDNRAQVQDYAAAAPIFETLRIALRGMTEFFRGIFEPYYSFQADWRPGWLLILSLVGIGWVVDIPLSRSWRGAAFALIVAGVMVFVSFIPGAYVYRGTIPLRSQMIPSFYLALGSVAFGFLLPRTESKRIANAVVFFILVCLFFGMITAFPQLLDTIKPMREYAAAWDARDAAFKSSAGLPGRIDVPWDEYEQELDCIQLYYSHLRGIDSLEGVIRKYTGRN